VKVIMGYSGFAKAEGFWVFTLARRCLCMAGLRNGAWPLFLLSNER
jgi:hypothetical protein